jgi:hypothetical protein
MLLEAEEVVVELFKVLKEDAVFHTTEGPPWAVRLGAAYVAHCNDMQMAVSTGALDVLRLIMGVTPFHLDPEAMHALWGPYSHTPTLGGLAERRRHPYDGRANQKTTPVFFWVEESVRRIAARAPTLQLLGQSLWPCFMTAIERNDIAALELMWAVGFRLEYVPPRPEARRAIVTATAGRTFDQRAGQLAAFFKHTPPSYRPFFKRTSEGGAALPHRRPQLMMMADAVAAEGGEDVADDEYEEEEEHADLTTTPRARCLRVLLARYEVSATTIVPLPTFTRPTTARSPTTPLHLAAELGESADVLRTLLEAGADPDARDRAGHTPYACFVRKQQQAWAHISTPSERLALATLRTGMLAARKERFFWFARGMTRRTSRLAWFACLPDEILLPLLEPLLLPEEDSPPPPTPAQLRARWHLEQ